MKTSIDFKSALQKLYDYSKGTEFETGNRYVTGAKYTLWEHGRITIAGLMNDPDHRRNISRLFNVEAVLLSEYRGKLKTLDGRTIPKSHIDCATLLVDREHGMIVNGDKEITYYNENMYPIGDTPLSCHTYDKVKTSKYTELLLELTAMFVIEDFNMEGIGGIAHTSYAAPQAAFLEVIQKGKLNRCTARVIRDGIRHNRGATPSTVVDKLIKNYGYDVEEFKYLVPSEK